jgi:hypothetical protein
MEPVEATAIGDEPRPLFLEDLPYGLLRAFRVRVGLGPGDAPSMSQAFKSRAAVQITDYLCQANAL